MPILENSVVAKILSENKNPDSHLRWRWTVTVLLEHPAGQGDDEIVRGYGETKLKARKVAFSPYNMSRRKPLRT